ncbi:MAG: twin-arginine translocation signal domain-containing protein [Coriobacteriales bacterium]|nr:twin-arginine translocation signal domain-containing protein [Coriobacteriales bacterium]
MAITRRQFVTRLGALAAAVGFSQADVSKIAEAFAGNSTNLGGTAGKPRVIWIHGAECTGCSTSLLGILEDPAGEAVFGTGITTGAAVGLAGVTATGSITGAADNPFTLWTGGASPVNAVEGSALVNIADVVLDVVDLQYHETVMGMGGDLAYKWLADFRANGQTATPFVLVVEGALQKRTDGGAWSDTSDTTVPWCSIGMGDATGEHDMAETVVDLAKMTNCAAILPIGQCATFGGYPKAKPRLSSDSNGMNTTMSQTNAKGVYDYLIDEGGAAATAAAKVINVPGCPTNPWWFVLNVVMVMADLVSGAGLVLPPVVGTTLDATRRAKKAYPIPVHSAYCPRYPSYNKGIYATKPGDSGCLQKLGCKGIATNSLCGVHGWNNQQPENAGSISSVVGNAGRGGHCTTAGHPCMACTEKGYPDSFVPFVKR